MTHAHRPRARYRAWGPVVLAMFVTACSGQGHDDRDAARAGAPRVARHEVVLRAIRFEPESLEVAVGDTVVWINHDVVPHTSTSSDRHWVSGNIAPDSSWSTVVAWPGRLPYACEYHPMMKGTLLAR